jgi:3-oxoadipate CoA-transferase alpha subunit
VFQGLWEQGSIELEVVPQGTLSERIRAGGSGIGAFFTATGVGTELTVGRETRSFPDGSVQVLESAIRGDFSLISAQYADRWGNLTYDKAQRNFGPTMAMAASVTIVEVARIVPLGGLDPETIVTPGVVVDRVVEVLHVS